MLRFQSCNLISVFEVGFVVVDASTRARVHQLGFIKSAEPIYSIISCLALASLREVCIGVRCLAIELPCRPNVKI